jgi:outer membrane protein assembly factor BamB
MSEPTSRKPLRLWPGVACAIVLVVGRYILPEVARDAEVGSVPIGLVSVLGGMLAAVGIVVWWMFFSRAAWLERVIALVLLIGAVFALRPIVHESIRGGMMGMMPVIYAVPILCLAIVVWAVATRRFSTPVRRASLVAAIVLACVPFVLIRTAGISGVGSHFHWRWTPTPEQVLLAQAGDAPTPAPPAAAPAPATVPEAPAAAKADAAPAAAPPAPAAPGPSPAAPAADAPAEWPGFRGPGRDGIVRELRIETNWAQSPPVELWRRPIGPGWSSFAVRGDLVYTQEQRGEEEVVAAYRLSTGAPVWQHRDRVRFWESNAGAGPRGTPSIAGNRVYAFGATGILNALDAASGTRLWSRNAATDTGVEVPGWGFASSPLPIDDIVVIAVSGRLAAYDASTGAPRWKGPEGGAGYSSPHLVTIDGVPQIMLLRGSRTISVAPADGALVWEHVGEPGVSILQPALVSDRELLIPTSDSMGATGMRRVAASRGTAGWNVEERWTSRGLKPYFNDFVVHEGHAFGFDGSILACIDVADGQRKWKGGRYGQGQLVLLAEQDLLLLISEDGELALVSATPDQFKEVARFPALDGKTWNHPVLVGNVLLVRNDHEMAAFRLKPAAHAASAAAGAQPRSR